jgi:ribulose 1,5-bisphosphate synthetase/thiazole synthase
MAMKSVSSRRSVDVLVVGGGPAGAATALAAAWQGAKVMLVERYGFLGGLGTQVLDTICGYYASGNPPVQIVGGVPETVVRELEVRSRLLLRQSTVSATQVIAYHPEVLKCVWDELLGRAGVQVLFHALVFDVRREGDRVTGVLAATKRGIVQLEAGVVVDASGDADVAFAAGVPCEQPPEEDMQAMATTFRLMHVDVERARQVSREELKRLMSDAVDTGDFALPRREGSLAMTPLPGVITVNMTRVTGLDPTDPDALSEAERIGRDQALECFRFLKARVAGYASAELAQISSQIGVRESRRISGLYRLMRDDVLSARKFDDGIARGGWPIEDHRSVQGPRLEGLGPGEYYGIPYRCMLPVNIDGLLVVGRAVSADHDAHASVRVMGTCMAMGHAAGVAAALAAARGASPHSILASEVREQVVRRGGMV